MIMNKNGKLIAEFFLVVMGVLFALMIEGVLEDRQSDVLRDEYLLRLDADIQADRQAIAHRIEFFTDVKQFSRDLLGWLNADVPIDKEILLASFYAAEVFPYVAVRSTYEDLHSTGNVRLIGDIELRTSLSAYYNKADESRPGWSPSAEFREIIRGVIPPDIQDRIREHCPTTDARDLVPTGFPPCELPGADYAMINELFVKLKGDQNFRRKLTYRDSELGVTIYLLAQQLDLADIALGSLHDQ